MAAVSSLFVLLTVLLHASLLSVVVLNVVAPQVSFYFKTFFSFPNILRLFREKLITSKITRFTANLYFLFLSPLFSPLSLYHPFSFSLPSSLLSLSTILSLSNSLPSLLFLSLSLPSPPLSPSTLFFLYPF